MGSLKNVEEGKKAMWLYPKVIGSNPSERWGHSSCFFQGHLYVFGGCCGGMHFSDVLVLNLETMAWNTLVTLGNGPGPRDSHSATLWGDKIIVFGGTNGSKKVNDLHILDLGTKEWIQPMCTGTPPSARESHTATLVSDEMLVVFGGSGEGVGNYLNDLHILDLKAMSWTSPNVKGDIPPPRDSHISIAVDDKLFVYGGDCGDRYHGDVEMFDIGTLTWTRLEVQGLSPGRRAGHAAVKMETKMYVLGGVGDKKYYNDAWVLNTTTQSWARLEICGQSPQGRFSHTAVVTGSDIAIYGGCGEDERPLGELLILQLGAEHQNGRYNISMCKSFGNRWNQGRRRGRPTVENGLKTMLLGSCIEVARKDSLELDNLDSKRLKRSVNANTWERDSEPDEHSLSVSQNSSPSQSDHEQTTAPTPTVSQGFNCPSLSHLNKSPTDSQSHKSPPQQNFPDVYILGEHRANMRRAQFLSSCNAVRSQADTLTTPPRPMNHVTHESLLGADVQGKVDGAFDSGYLISATVNGRIFRGVLFAPGPSIMHKATNGDQSIGSGHASVVQPYTNLDRGLAHRKSPFPQQIKSPGLGCSTGLIHEKLDTPSPLFRAVQSRQRELRDRSDLQGVVLTLGGPGAGCSHG